MTNQKPEVSSIPEDIQYRKQVNCWVLPAAQYTNTSVRETSNAVYANTTCGCSLQGKR